MQFERRAALVPGSKLPSPEEAQLILHQREFSEPPAPLRVDAGQNRPLPPSTRSNPKVGLALQIPQPKNHHAPLAEIVQLHPTSPEPGTSHPPQEPRQRSTFHLPSRGRQPHPGHKASAQVRLDHKRKHAYYSQDQQRQYPPLLSEDILHMSEVAAEDGIKASGKEIFGDRGTSSVFDQVAYGYTDPEIQSPKAWEIQPPRSTDTCRALSSLSAVSPRDMSLTGIAPFWSR